MKKTLVALAALAATASYAQSVELWGSMDIGVATATTKSADGTSVDKTTGVVDGTQAPNRLGFRGTEDLGGGLKAGFNLEMGFAPSSNNGWNVRVASSAHQVPGGGAFSGATMRTGNLWLGGGFGEVRLGTQFRSLYGNVMGRAIVMAESFGGEQHGLIAPARMTGISYTSPNISGLTVQAQYGGPHGQRWDRSSAADASDGFRRDKSEVFDLSVAYVAGPLALAAGYENQKMLRVSNAAAATNFYGGTVAAGAAANRTESAWGVGGSYDFGVAKLNATYGKRNNVNAALADAGNWNVSVTVPVGALVLMAHYMDYEVKPEVAGAKLNDVTGYQLGARYNLSKRTNVYVHFLSDKDKALAATAQSKRDRRILGVAHSF